MFDNHTSGIFASTNGVNYNFFHHWIAASLNSFLYWLRSTRCHFCLEYLYTLSQL